MAQKRIWEIDLLRSIAIVLMIIFHTVYDLNAFLGIDVNYTSGFWYWEGKVSALLFIFLSGISSGFSRSHVKRGLITLALGLGISAVTYFVLGDMYIRYGILHFLGTCMLLYPLLAPINPWVLAALSAGIAYLAGPVRGVIVKTSLLLPLGLRYRGFATVDYYPLIPYLAVFLLGIIAYKLYYHKRRSLFAFSLENRFISWTSSKSLWIYVLHQPLVAGVIMLYKYLA